MTLIKVKDNSNLVRDSETGAIINVSAVDRDNAIARHRALKNKDKQLTNTIDQVNNLSERVDNIETKLDAIIDLLRKGS